MTSEISSGVTIGGTSAEKVSTNRMTSTDHALILRANYADSQAFSSAISCLDTVFVIFLILHRPLLSIDSKSTTEISNTHSLQKTTLIR